ncbi:MAG: hypothetical protein ABI680_10385 [Chthoniobacteraceae bacterium]
MDLSPDGRTLASGTGFDQRAIQLWDALTGEPLRTMEGHADYVTDLAFSPDGATLASVSSDETLRLWQTATGREAAPALCGNGDEVEAVDFSSDGKRLVTGSRDGLVLLWETAERRLEGGRHFLPVTTIFAFLLPGGRNAFILEPGNRRSFIDVETNLVTPLALTVPQQGFWGGPNFLGFPGDDRVFQLFEITDAGGKLLAALPLGREVDDWFAYAPEARLLAWTEPHSAVIHVTPIDRPHAQIDLTSDGEISRAAAFDLTGRYLLAQGPDGTARVWDIAARRRIPEAEDYFSPFGVTAFGDIRNALAAPAIREWIGIAVRPPAKPRRFRRSDPAPPGFWPAGHVTSRAYSPDGHTTAMATENGSIVLFDAESQKKIATLHGHAHSVFALAFSPDGSRLFSANDAIWDVETKQELVALAAVGALHSIAQFSDDGKTLFAGSWHGSGEYQYWRAPTLAEIEAAERNDGGWPRRNE